MKRYWPGGSGHWATSPVYGLHVPVIDTTGYSGAWTQNLETAIKWWNECGARVILTRGHGDPWLPGSITVYKDDQGPYGWYDPTRGLGYVAMVRGDGDKPTIAHELGHALGFGHTGISSSIMSQWNTWSRSGVGRLDKRGLRHHYGRR